MVAADTEFFSLPCIRELTPHMIHTMREGAIKILPEVEAEKERAIEGKKKGRSECTESSSDDHLASGLLY